MPLKKDVEKSNHELKEQNRTLTSEVESESAATKEEGRDEQR